jgi:nitrate reductase cytochrome c-type subunit
MTSLKIWTGVCAALLLVTMLVSGTAVAQDPKVQDPKVQDTKTVEGMLMGIDQNAKVLTLKTGDKQIQFSYTEQTELVTPENDGKPAVVKQGTKVRVHYTEREKTMIATKIEILEASGN